MTRLMVDVHERPVDLREFLELVLQRLAPALPQKPNRISPQAPPLEKADRRTHTSCATLSVVSPFMTRSTSTT